MCNFASQIIAKSRASDAFEDCSESSCNCFSGSSFILSGSVVFSVMACPPFFYLKPLLLKKVHGGSSATRAAAQMKQDDFY